MRTLIILIAAVLVGNGAMAQIKDPVKWTATSVKKGDSYLVILSATLPKPWHIYSQHTGKGGPLPTTIKFAQTPLLTFTGAVKEVGKLKEEYDSNFDTKVKYYGEKVDFVQTVKVKGNIKTNVNVTVEYMTCDDSQCLPPTKKTFNVSL
ncbi:protein-disulfide reductase DsbD domain-containing protein [Aridibaculum aurantiacum]|uniref:protein-disulfide reductase DsbD domain-containing protein n=1 Tax=Aridibaculum aurantiacum TaxID=2810307 RepID=UPI001A9584BF|nr:protein-disulfide reductase DsbD domain-containing protein [Aridibaculum aurantiacum]